MTIRFADFFILESAPYTRFCPLDGGKDSLSMKQNMKALVDPYLIGSGIKC